MKTMVVPARDMEYWNRWLRKDEIDFNNVWFSANSTVFSQSVDFDDGFCAELRVRSGETCLYTEMAWFDENGHQVGCYANGACLGGIWESGEGHDVEVLARLNKKGE